MQPFGKSNLSENPTFRKIPIVTKEKEDLGVMLPSFKRLHPPPRFVYDYLLMQVPTLFKAMMFDYEH